MLFEGKLLFVGMIVHMRVDDKSAQMVVQIFVNFISDHIQDIETGKNGLRQVDVLAEGKG